MTTVNAARRQSPSGHTPLWFTSGFSMLLLAFLPHVITAQTPLTITSDTVITAEVPAPSDTGKPVSVSTPDTADSLQHDTTNADSSLPAADSLLLTDSLRDTSSAFLRPAMPSDSQSSSPTIPSVPAGISAEDSAGVPEGLYFSAGIGWTIGGFELLSLWENAQPDSLQQLGLDETSFGISYDSLLQNDESVDTGLLSFSIKEAPAVYTMSFPITLSLVSIRKKHRLSASLSGSWMRKLFTGTIAATGDTLDRKVDLKETINIYILLLSLQWGGSIPDQYFSIEGVERSFFTIGLDLAPVVASRIHRTAASTSDHPRFTALEYSLSRSDVRFFHGGSAGIRLGISMIKRLNARSATDFGIVYTIQGYGYFLENGNRVYFNDIDPSARKKDRPLFWISNRLELSFAFLRRLRK